MWLAGDGAFSLDMNLSTEHTDHHLLAPGTTSRYRPSSVATTASLYRFFQGIFNVSFPETQTGSDISLSAQWVWFNRFWVWCTSCPVEVRSYLFPVFFNKRINSNHLINQQLRIKSTTLPQNINHNSKNKTFSHSPICPAFTLNGTSNSLWNTNTHYYIFISQPVSALQSSDWTSSDVCYQKHCGWWHHREGTGPQTHQSILLHLQVLQDYISCKQTQWSH